MSLLTAVLMMGVIGGIIGWMTNLIAIRLLFKPITPLVVPVMGWKIQGLIPQRHAEIAVSVAETIETELLSIERVLDKMIETLDKQAVLALLEEKISQAILSNLPPLAKTFSGTILKYLHEMIEKQGEDLLNQITEKLLHEAIERISVKDMVTEQILAIDLKEIERITVQLAKTELKQIERLGGLIGALIGGLQGLIAYFVF